MFSDQVRDAWKLGMDPISDLTDILEGLGLLVIIVDEESPGFSGLTATARTGDGRSYPIVAVSSRWPGDRQRFTLAHELGHLLLSGRLAAGIDEEKACDRFAGAFLAPQVAVTQALGLRRRILEWQELYALKHEFGLSMAGCSGPSNADQFQRRCTCRCGNNFPQEAGEKPSRPARLQRNVRACSNNWSTAHWQSCTSPNRRPLNCSVFP